jgi:hypothetical protein
MRLRFATLRADSPAVMSNTPAGKAKHIGAGSLAITRIDSAQSGRQFGSGVIVHLRRPSDDVAAVWAL